MTATLRELTGKSGFVFEGAVRRMGAVTTSGVPVAPDMAVVLVIKVLKAPSMLLGFTGKEITVQLRRHETVHEGLQAVFFTTGLHFGDGLAVKEVDRLDVRGAALEKDVREAMHQASDDELIDRLNQAEIVVSGVAIKTAPYERPSVADHHVSEHDPDWWECIIEVETVEKGTVKTLGKAKPAATVLTLFAHSTDIRWYRSPKFEKGDAGVWFLHRIVLKGARVPELVTVHRLDFHPISSLDYVRALLKRIKQ